MRRRRPEATARPSADSWSVIARPCSVSAVIALDPRLMPKTSARKPSCEPGMPCRGTASPVSSARGSGGLPSISAATTPGRVNRVSAGCANGRRMVRLMRSVRSMNHRMRRPRRVRPCGCWPVVLPCFPRSCGRRWCFLPLSNCRTRKLRSSLELPSVPWIPGFSGRGSGLRSGGSSRNDGLSGAC